MKRGFVFAPLLGTTLLLVSILFVSHIARTETGLAKEITSDAYHNRLISLLETVRSDYMSEFKLGLAQGVYVYLLNAPKTGLADLNFNSDQTRESWCDANSDVISRQVCSTGAYGTEGASILSWFKKITEELSFEGTQFYAKSKAGAVDELGSFDGCMTFVDSKTINCAAFAKRKLECKDSPLHGPEDCSDGTFFIDIDVEKVYDRLPRICAKDLLGNEICSGGMADRNFAIHPKIRIYKYFDLVGAFRDALAYGDDYDAATTQNLNAVCPAGRTDTGLLDGLCCESANVAANNNCKAYASCSSTNRCTAAAGLNTRTTDALRALFADACADKLAAPTTEIKPEVSNTNVITQAGAAANRWACKDISNAANLAKIVNVLDISNTVTSNKAGQASAITANQISPLIVLTDTNPTYRITNKDLDVRLMIILQPRPTK